MIGPELTGIIVAVVGIFIVVAVILLSIIISYRIWKKSPRAERRKFCLHHVFKNYWQTSEDDKAIHENKRNLKISQTIEHPTINTEQGSDNQVFTTVSYSDNQAVINPEYTLRLPDSPIRTSAETYSVVDLNGDG